MTPNSPEPDWNWRRRARQALERHFVKQSAPRLILSLILIVTALAAFAISVGLLRAGLFAMWLRYPLAVLLGYGVFIGLLRLWIEFERSRFHPRGEEIAKAIAELETSPRESPVSERRYRYGRWWDWFDLPQVLEPGEGCLVVVLMAIVLGLVGLAVFAVLSAQALLAEVFLDAFIVSILYRRLRIAAREGWLGTALRRTWLLVLGTAALLALAGWCLQAISPGAHSIGPALQKLVEPAQSPRQP